MELRAETGLPPVIRESLGVLLRAAEEARANAYCPASEFPVGAAVLAQNGTIYSGCNVENASYGLTICAERNALGAMVAAGQLKLNAVVVLAGSLVSPCGACRQVLIEFTGNADVPVIFAVDDPPRVEGWAYLQELLPLPFRFDRQSQDAE